MHSKVVYVPGIVKQILKSVFQDQNVTKLCPPEILFVGLMIAPPCFAAYVNTYPFVHVSWQFQA